MFYHSQCDKENIERRSAICKGNSLPKRDTWTHLSEAQRRAGQCSGYWRISPDRYWEPRLQALPTWLDPQDKVFKNHGSFFISLSHDHRRIYERKEKRKSTEKNRWFFKLIFPTLPKGGGTQSTGLRKHGVRSTVRYLISRWRTKPIRRHFDAAARNSHL